jgi:hypothetical protein
MDILPNRVSATVGVNACKPSLVTITTGLVTGTHLGKKADRLGLKFVRYPGTRQTYRSNFWREIKPHG